MPGAEDVDDGSERCADTDADEHEAVLRDGEPACSAEDDWDSLED